MNSTLEKRFDTPILFIIFNRLDTTKIVFEEIRKIKPSRLYIAGDGPREKIDDDELKVAAVRDYVLKTIDWDCDVKTLFRDKNLGCKYAVSSAITWFFENEPWGIILEDDCVPDQSFFWFCEELLQKYRDDTRIMMISGINLADKWYSDGQSYHFSIYGGIWGWASWRRAWKYYDLEMKLWDNPKAKKTIKDLMIFKDQCVERIHLFQKTYDGKIDTWDYQWSFARMTQSGLSIVPNVNLIKNIGFGIEATHTNKKLDDKADLAIHSLAFPIKINPFIVADREYDKIFYMKNSHKGLQHKFFIIIYKIQQLFK